MKKDRKEKRMKGMWDEVERGPPLSNTFLKKFKFFSVVRKNYWLLSNRKLE